MPNPQTFRAKSIVGTISDNHEPNYSKNLISKTYDGFNSNLDMFSAQDYAEDFLYAISGLEKEQNPIILFSNIESEFELNNQKISKKFPNAIWIKDNRLITCMEGAKFSKDVNFSHEVEFKAGEKLDIEGIKKILNSRGINFIELKSVSSEKPIDSNLIDIPETWFGRGNEVFIEALANISDKRVTLYPNVNGKLVLKFYHTPTTFSIIDERVFAGLIEFDNKILLTIVPSSKIQKLAKTTATLDSRGLSESNSELLNYQPLIGSFNSVIQFLISNGYKYYIDEGNPKFLVNENGKGEIQNKINK